MSGIGNFAATLADRAIPLRMMRKLKDEKVERLKRQRLEADALPLRRQAMRWAADHMANLREATPVLPPALNDRQGDGWEPLFAIADLAGDEWPKLARKAALALIGATDNDHGERGTMMLGDLRDIFGEADKLASEVIVEKLVAMEDRPWPEWNRGKPLTAPGLAKILKPYEVKPKQVWADGRNCRGYEHEQLAPLWARYLEPVGSPGSGDKSGGKPGGKPAESDETATSSDPPDSGSQTETASQPLGEKDFCDNRTETAEFDVTGRKAQNPLREKDRDAVTGRSPKNGGSETQSAEEGSEEGEADDLEPDADDFTLDGEETPDPEDEDASAAEDDPDPEEPPARGTSTVPTIPPGTPDVETVTKLVADWPLERRRDWSFMACDLEQRFRGMSADDASRLAYLELDAPPLAANPPHGLGRCFECAAELPAGVEIARCHPCHKRHDPHAHDVAPAVPFPPAST